MEYAHYTNFGASGAPSCADSEGFIALRDGYESLPDDEQTPAEQWAADRIADIVDWQDNS